MTSLPAVLLCLAVTAADKDAVMGRLHALAHAQEFISAGPSAGVPLQQLIDAELVPFAARAVITGEPLVVGGSFQSDGMPGIFSQMATHEILPVGK